MSTFYRITLWQRFLEWLIPARRRRRQAAMRAEIRRLVTVARDEEVRFR